MGKTFVLVHGAYHGGWCWRRVANILTAQGHEVFAPTLTGLADRSHLLGTFDINLTTHITDVVNLFEWEDVLDAVLVGHSYGGWVISGAMERLEGKVRSIVFVDAHVPKRRRHRPRKGTRPRRHRNSPHNGRTLASAAIG
jgi:pimeloyl-ACP methyl ester carboxylesterase